MVVKQVKFFDPILIEPDGRSRAVRAGFWADLMRHIGGVGQTAREFRYNAAAYYGEPGTGTAPAVSYLRIGRIRERADWPDTVDDTYRIEPLNLQRRKLFEAAYLVPFGARNQVAFMGPLRGIVSVRAVENWITSSLNLAPTGRSIELRPIVDPALARKLRDAQAVSKLTVRIPHDADVSLNPRATGTVDAAINDAIESGQDAVDIEMTFSFGRRAPRGPVAAELLRVTRLLSRIAGPDKIEASLVLQDGDGFKTEQHDLIRDNMTARARFDVPDDRHVDLNGVLEGIQRAIQEFRAQA